MCSTSDYKSNIVWRKRLPLSVLGKKIPPNTQNCAYSLMCLRSKPTDQYLGTLKDAFGKLSKWNFYGVIDVNVELWFLVWGWSMTGLLPKARGSMIG